MQLNIQKDTAKAYMAQFYICVGKSNKPYNVFSQLTDSALNQTLKHVQISTQVMLNV